MKNIALIIKPDAEDPDCAEVLVDGTIGGHKYRFLLDTGAAVSQVKHDDYLAGFTSVGKRETGGAFSRSSLDLITVTSITLGPILERDFTLARVPADAPNNLIGMDLLKKHRLAFYFDQNRVVIDPDAPPTTGSLNELTPGQKWHPYIDVYLEGVTARAVWDSGSGITVVDSGFVSKHPGYFRRTGISQGTDSAGSSGQTEMYEISAMIIGGRKFHPQKVAALDMAKINADVILGYNTLCQANWFFDFPGKNWSVINMLPQAK